MDARDIDLLYANLGSSDPVFDLNGDGVADRQDVQRLVEDVLGRRFGDTDLDQKIDIQDVNAMITNFDPLGTDPHNGWARGDFDGDGDVDIADFNQLVRNYSPLGYVREAPDICPGELYLRPRTTVVELEVTLLWDEPA